jgi:hypothetical protein
MKTKPTKLRLPVLTVMLLTGIFVFGAATGAFMYATGTHVINDVYMKMVSHTEYRYGEQGQIIARLVDFQGNPVVVQSCNATILYPDKSYFVNMATMSESVNISGDHYYGFTTPSGPEGVYEYQATCFFMQGMQLRNQSVTNSFHLSGAFNAIMDNQTLQNLYLEAIQGNLTDIGVALQELSLELAAVNSSLSGEILALSEQLNTNVTMLFDQADGNYLSLQTQLNANVTQILDAIDTIDVEVNFTPVFDAIDALELAMESNFTYTNNLISTLSDDVNSNFTVAFNYFNALNVSSGDIYSVLLNVNDTTTNTYQYLTGTLTTNLNDVLTQLGVINATVNRIETNTVAINATVNTILDNQQNQVYMSVFSG